MPTITSLETQQHDPQRVNVYLDGAFVLGLSRLVVLSSGLHEGREVTAEELAALAEEDAAERAYDAALNFLSYRPRSRKEIEDYFRRKKAEPETVERVVARLERAGFLDDHEFARFWVENRLNFKPRGTRALRVELRRKGVDGEVIDDALQVVDDEEEIAYRAAAKKARSYAQLDEREFFARMTGFLQRRGFPWSVAAVVARRCFEDVKAERATLELKPVEELDGDDGDES